MDRDHAEIIAINGLSFIASNEKYLSHYIKLSGISLEQLQEGTSNPSTMPNILASIIDFFLQNENYLIEFSEENHITPDQIAKTRIFFPGANPNE